jgi:hypothetical protein
MPNRTPARPEYSLVDVKRLAHDETNVQFVARQDGGTDLDALGMTKHDACTIITQLQPRDYDVSSYQGQSPADVYIVKRPTLPRPLYIKLKINEDGALLIVISFHLTK